MKPSLLILISMLLTGCVSTEGPYDNTYKRAEIAQFSADHFDVYKGDLMYALGPTFKKYGQPSMYVLGRMSSVNEPETQRLYGVGLTRRKVGLPGQTFWQIDGQGLNGHMKPIKAAHILYDVINLEMLTEVLPRIGSLSKRGQKFTIFEREQDGLIIVSINKTVDLPEKSAFGTIRFFEN